MSAAMRLAGRRIVVTGDARGAAHYAATKGGVIVWRRSIAHAWGKHGIRVNVVTPAVETPMQREVLQRKRSPETERRAFSSAVPLGAVGLAEDVAPSVVFLLSDEARYVTAQIRSIDGGLCPLR